MKVILSFFLLINILTSIQGQNTRASGPNLVQTKKVLPNRVKNENIFDKAPIKPFPTIKVLGIFILFSYI
jgi:hypothetical protein